MFQESLKNLTDILEAFDKVEKDFDLEGKFKKKPPKQDQNMAKVKEMMQNLKDGKGSLEELEDAIKEVEDKEEPKDKKDSKTKKEPEEAKDNGKKSTKKD